MSKYAEFQRQVKQRACGNPECSTSSGFHDGLTFGSGDLDDWGYWEFPCGPCARDYERRFPGEEPCWPFEPPAEEGEETP